MTISQVTQLLNQTVSHQWGIHWDSVFGRVRNMMAGEQMCGAVGSSFLLCWWYVVYSCLHNTV